MRWKTGVLAAGVACTWFVAAVAAEPADPAIEPAAESAATGGGRLAVSLVKDLNPGPDDGLNISDFSSNQTFATYRNELYFGANGGPGVGSAIYKVGKDGAAVLVADTDPRDDEYVCCRFAEYRNELYFTADGGPDIGGELFKLSKDGRVALVEDINKSGSSFPQSFFKYNGVLLFSAKPASQIYAVNKMGQVVPITDTQKGDVSRNSEFILFRGELYFSGYRPDVGDAKIYKMTHQGKIVLVQDPGDLTSFPEAFTEYRGELYFVGYRPDIDYGLFKLTADGRVVLVANVNPGLEFFEFRGELYFQARNPDTGDYELNKLRKDNVVVRVSALHPGSGGLYDFKVYRGELYVCGYLPDVGEHSIFKVRQNGTLDLVTDKFADSDFRLTEYRGELYFREFDRRSQTENLAKLRKDGSIVSVADILPIHLLTEFRGLLYFWGFGDDAIGRELYKLGPAEY